MATTTTISTSNYIVTPAISDTVKDAWNKLVSDLNYSGISSAVVTDLREGLNEMSSDIKKDVQSTVTNIENDIQSVFAAFVTSTSSGMTGLQKTAYEKIMNNASSSLRSITDQMLSDFWKSVDSYNTSINSTLDKDLQGLSSNKVDLNQVANDVFSATKTEFNVLINALQSDLVGKYQSVLVSVGLAAGAAGLTLTSDQWSQLGNSIVSAVSIDIVAGAAKTGADLTVDFFETTTDLSKTVISKKDSLLAIAVIDGVNLIQTAAKSVWKKIKSWFK